MVEAACEEDDGEASFAGVVLVSFVVSEDELFVEEELPELGASSCWEQAARPSRGIARVATSDFRRFMLLSLFTK